MRLEKGLRMVTIRSIYGGTGRGTSYLEMIYHAWMTPGIHPRIHRRMFIQRSAEHPRLRATGTGGMNMARKYNKTF